MFQMLKSGLESISKGLQSIKVTAPSIELGKIDVNTENIEKEISKMRVVLEKIVEKQNEPWEINLTLE